MSHLVPLCKGGQYSKKSKRVKREYSKLYGEFTKESGVLEISCQSDKIQILRVENARRKTNRF